MQRTHTLLRPLFAALLLTVLLGCIAVPAYAADVKTSEVKAEATLPNLNELFPNVVGERKTVWVGDSRTAHLRQSMTGVLDKTWFGEDAVGVWDYKWGAKYGNFSETLIPQLDQSNYLRFGTTVVIWIGYNDAVGIRTAEAKDYAAKINEAALRWGVRGARVVVVNIGPAGNVKNATKDQKKDAKTRNQKIEAYNKELTGNLLPGIQTVDLYGYLTGSGNYATVDNTHYTQATSKRIYKYVSKQIS